MNAFIHSYSVIYSDISYIVDNTHTNNTRPLTPHLYSCAACTHRPKTLPPGLPPPRVSAELAIHLIDKVFNSLEQQPVSEEDRLVAGDSIPTPMIPGNWEPQSERCFIGPNFRSSVQDEGGFEWVNDALDPARPKWGYVATTPGSKLKMKVGGMGVGGWGQVGRDGRGRVGPGGAVWAWAGGARRGGVGMGGWGGAGRGAVGRARQDVSGSETTKVP